MTKQLECYYLMIIIKYLNNLTTLQQFHLINKKCNEAIDATKINPNYQSESLETLLTNTELFHCIKEISIFQNIQTLSISSDILEQLYQSHSDYLENSIHLINITDFVLKTQQKQTFALKKLQHKIGELKLDCEYVIDKIDLKKCQQMKKLTIRIGYCYIKKCYDKYINECQFIPYLHLTLHFHSKYYQLVDEIIPLFPKLSLICTCLDNINCLHLINILHKHRIYQIGVLYHELQLYSQFLSDEMILLLQRNDFLHLANEMINQPYFNKLLKQYYPYRLEIVGKQANPIICQNETIIDFSQLKELSRLHLFDSQSKHVKYLLPFHLEELRINCFCSKDQLIHFDKLQTNLQKNCFFD